MTTKAKAKVEEEDVVTEEEVVEREGPSGPVLTPAEPRPAVTATLAEAGEPQPNSNIYDDGVEDIDLPPPQAGQFVRITGGDYAGRFAVYLGDVAVPDDEKRKIQVRTRDADNLTVDVPYADVASTPYSGGR